MEITFESIIGKTILIGLTYLNKENELLEQKQIYGTIEHADKSKGISIKQADTGDWFYLPPELNSLSIAAPGEYRLRSTGEVIADPDLLSMWTIHNP